MPPWFSNAGFCAAGVGAALGAGSCGRGRGASAGVGDEAVQPKRKPKATKRGSCVRSISRHMLVAHSPDSSKNRRRFAQIAPRKKSTGGGDLIVRRFFTRRECSRGRFACESRLVRARESVGSRARVGRSCASSRRQRTQKNGAPRARKPLRMRSAFDKRRGHVLKPRAMTAELGPERWGQSAPICMQSAYDKRGGHVLKPCAMTAKFGEDDWVKALHFACKVETPRAKGPRGEIEERRW